MRKDNFKIGQFFKKIGLINQNQINVILEEQKQNNKLFGMIMIDKKVLSENLFNNLLDASSGNNQAIKKLQNKKIGELIVDLEYSTDQKVNECISEQKNTSKKLGEIIHAKGYISKSQLNKVLSIQKKIAALFLTGLVSSSFLTACKTPHVTNNFGIVQNYSESQVMKVLKTNPTGNVNSYVDGTIEVSNIPFYQQANDNTCGQAVMASILNYWGKGVSYQDVVNQTNSWNMFTDVDKITQYLRKRGLYAQDYRMATINLLKDRINKGLPPIVLLDFGSLSSEHYVIVKGYNESTKTFIVSDPIDGPNIKINYDAFASMWENRSLNKLGIFGDKYNRIVFDVGGN